MRFYVSADETGNVKELVFQEGTDTSLKESNQPELIRNILETSEHTTVKTRIQHMFVTQRKQLIAARIGGLLDIHDFSERDSTDFGKLVHSYRLECEADDKPIALCNYEAHGFCIVAFESGRIFITDVNNYENLPILIELPGREENGPKSISAFTPNPYAPGVFAYGGKDNDLQIVRLFDKKSLTKVSADFSCATKWDLKILFQAENEEQDHLGIDVPVWITGILFHAGENKKAFKVVVATRFGQIRQYETSVEAGPTASYKICDKPIISLNFASNAEEEIIVTDTHTFVAKLSLVQIDKKAQRIVSASAGTFYKPSLKLLGKFSQGGNTGAINSVVSSPSSNAVAMGGLDRYLRVFDVKTRKMLGKVYVGTQISSIIFVEDDSSLSTDGKVDEEAEQQSLDEDLWRKLESNNEDQKPLLKKRKRRL